MRCTCKRVVRLDLNCHGKKILKAVVKCVAHAVVNCVVIFFQQKSSDILLMFFLFLHENICYGYLLEAPREALLMNTETYVFVEK